MPDDQIQEIPKKKKAEEKQTLEFEIGKVFSPAEAKDEDLQVDLQAARYSARQGQAGDRRPSQNPGDYVSIDEPL